MHGDTTYASPGKDKAATEGGEGEYSYAATTTVIGAKHSKPGAKPGGEKNTTHNVSAQPEKPKRGSNKHSPPADVPHKHGPVGDLYAMPDKKAQEVERKPGPQGDLYSMAAKPSKVSDQVYLVFVWHYSLCYDGLHSSADVQWMGDFITAVFLIYCDDNSCHLIKLRQCLVPLNTMYQA